MASLGGTDLGQVLEEKIAKEQPLIPLNSVTGDTKDNLLASLIGANRRISLRGTITFASTAARDLWFQTIDGYLKPANFTSNAYDPDIVSQVYTTPPATTYSVFVERFEINKEEGEGAYHLHYSLELVEGSGIGD